MFCLWLSNSTKWMKNLNGGNFNFHFSLKKQQQQHCGNKWRTITFPWRTSEWNRIQEKKRWTRIQWLVCGDFAARLLDIKAASSRPRTKAKTKQKWKQKKTKEKRNIAALDRSSFSGRPCLQWGGQSESGRSIDPHRRERERERRLSFVFVVVVVVGRCGCLTGSLTGGGNNTKRKKDDTTEDGIVFLFTIFFIYFCWSLIYTRLIEFTVTNERKKNTRKNVKIGKSNAAVCTHTDTQFKSIFFGKKIIIREWS